MIRPRWIPRSRLVVLSLVLVLPPLACDYRTASFDRQIYVESVVPILPPGRYMGPGEAGTPRSFGLGYLPPFSVDGSDLEHVRATTRRAIECGCDPRFGQHR